MLGQFAAVGIGAALGAWLRWGLAVWLNPRITQFPLGTLFANLIGGYLVGVAVAYLVARPDLPVHWRLFVVTGLLGRPHHVLDVFRRSDRVACSAVTT